MKRVFGLLGLVLLVTLLASPVMAAEKEWTFFVFLNADNNLDQFGVTDEQEMTKVGSSDVANIVTLIDRESGPANLHFIEKGNIKNLKDLGEVDMGDYKFMVSSFKEVAQLYPAKHYALVIWNHGSGWDKKNKANRGISYDDSTGNHITTDQLALACADIKASLGRNLDILSMDACLMQMAEVVYAVKDSTDFVVASEETEPGDGYPYDGILSGLKAGMTAADFAKQIVDAYTASYNNGTQGSKAGTQSAVDCAQMNALRTAIDELAKVAIKGKFGTQFKAALNSVQCFYYDDNKDLPHLLALLKKGISDKTFQTAATKVQDVLKKAIVANGHNGDTMANAGGLAVYFPVNSYSFSSEYVNLAWAKDTQWDEMVKDYYKKTNSSIVAEVAGGNVSSLNDFVAHTGTDNREIASDLVTKLNFLHTEGGLSDSMVITVSNLVKELKAK